MFYYLVAPTILVRKDKYTYTYHSNEEIARCTIVLIPIGNKTVSGIVIDRTPKPNFTTKAVLSILVTQPLPLSLLKLATWMSAYYSCPLPTALQSLLPAGLNKKRRQPSPPPSFASRLNKPITLNPSQRSAVDTITAIEAGTVLLHGITGSGKTQVYIELAKLASQNNQSTIVLVPEIALATQIVADFSQHFDNILVTHSNMTEAQRYQAWLRALLSTKPIIVIGPRSALFSPIQNIGLIVIDECHEQSFSQEQSPRYSALRAASKLASFHQSTRVVLGSATPSVNDYYIAKTTSKPIVRLDKPATIITPPKIELIDLKNRDNFKQHNFLSDSLINKIRQAIGNHKQTIIFLNRRGTAPTTLCTDCGWHALCQYCQVPLNLHADRHRLLCHLCGREYTIPPACPVCHAPEIMFKGIGTKAVETELRKIFPKSSIARFDADNSPSESLAARYQELYDAKIDIAIGTQMLAKGLDLPNLQVIGVIQAESGLQLPDYQAEERVYQLLYQVSGRVGRNSNESHVIVQSYRPDLPLIQFALRHDYDNFFNTQIEQRRKTNFPPFSFLLKLVCIYKTESGAISATKKLARDIQKKWPQLTVSAPAPAFYERVGGHYRWQLIIKSVRRELLVEVSEIVPQNWQVDIDPASLL